MLTKDDCSTDFYTYYRHLMEYTHQRGERQQRHAQNDQCLVGWQGCGCVRTMTATILKQIYHLLPALGTFCFPPKKSNEAKTETRLLRERRQRIALGHFQLQVKIGQGGYGQVFLARKQDTGELCALKRINKQQLNQSNEVSYTHCHGCCQCNADFHH